MRLNGETELPEACLGPSSRGVRETVSCRIITPSINPPRHCCQLSFDTSAVQVETETVMNYPPLKPFKKRIKSPHKPTLREIIQQRVEDDPITQQDRRTCAAKGLTYPVRRPRRRW